MFIDHYPEVSHDQTFALSTNFDSLRKMLQSSTAATVVAEVVEEKKVTEKDSAPLVLRLKSEPQQPVEDDKPHVTWADDVIDNEHLGRLKSNCCCIYTRPRIWDDPSTWEQDEHETEHCRGHTLPPEEEKRLAEHYKSEEDKDGEDPKKEEPKKHEHHGQHGAGCC